MDVIVSTKQFHRLVKKVIAGNVVKMSLLITDSINVHGKLHKKNIKLHRQHTHTSRYEWHYSLSHVTVSSSSSDDNSSSEESPQSHESSDSVSQELILSLLKNALLPQSLTVFNSASETMHCPGLLSNNLRRTSEQNWNPNLLLSTVTWGQTAQKKKKDFWDFIDDFYKVLKRSLSSAAN